MCQSNKILNTLVIQSIPGQAETRKYYQRIIRQQIRQLSYKSYNTSREKWTKINLKRGQLFFFSTDSVEMNWKEIWHNNHIPCETKRCNLGTRGNVNRWMDTRNVLQLFLEEWLNDRYLMLWTEMYWSFLTEKKQRLLLHLRGPWNGYYHQAMNVRPSETLG